jgi:hypothetical protein
MSRSNQVTTVSWLQAGEGIADKTTANVVLRPPPSR